jgi:hypothetical protein
MASAELVTINEHVAVCRDPTDDKFLDLAINGHADLTLYWRQRPVGAESIPWHPDCRASELCEGRAVIQDAA